MERQADSFWGCWIPRGEIISQKGCVFKGLWYTLLKWPPERMPSVPFTDNKVPEALT